MKTALDVQKDPRVKEAKQREQAQQAQIARMEEEREALASSAEQLHRQAKTAAAAAIVGDEEAEACEQAARDAEERAQRLRREIETHREALGMLQQKTRSAENEVRAEIASEVRAQHEKALQRFVDAVQEAQEALSDVVAVERETQPLQVEVHPHLRLAPSAYKLAFNGHGGFTFGAAEFLERAAGQGFRPGK